MHHKNLILYGPPGTGKTYLANHMAIMLAEGQTWEPEMSLGDLPKSFLKWQQEGRIASVTFHPSFGYEDFVEGIKPFKNQKQDLYYDIEDGIFKQICYNAAYALILAHQQRSLRGTQNHQKKGNFRHLHFEFTDYLRRMMKSDTGEIIFEADTGNAVILEDINHNDTYLFRFNQGKRSYPVSQSKLEVIYRLAKEEENLTREVIKKAIKTPHPAIYLAVYRRLQEFEKTRFKTYNYIINHRQLQGQAVSEEQYARMKQEISTFDYSMLTEEDFSQAGNFVLIIDEINRGNIASILGELITLLEPGKRAGMPEGQQTILPYSRERFSIPPNLYIIGTMNTADKSTDTFDLALRRRFYFNEITPRPELLDFAHISATDIHLPALLTTLNQRIEQLLDHDHLIGHAYFMPVKTAEEPLRILKDIFYQQIIPLLQEYFFTDPAKIELIIGKDFFDSYDSGKENYIFAETSSFAEDPPVGYGKSGAGKVKQLSQSAFNEAIKKIYVSRS